MSNADIVRPTPDQRLVAVTLPSPAPTLDRAGRVAHYHRLSVEASRVSVMAAIATGIELMRAHCECGHGRFLRWIEEHCPFTDRTARKYMRLAEMVIGPHLALSSGEAADLAQSTAAIVEARTLSALYTDLGIVSSTSKAGGRRPGAGRPRSDTRRAEADDAARAREDAIRATGDIAALLDLICAAEMWRALGRQDARAFIALVRDRLAVIAAGIEQL